MYIEVTSLIFEVDCMITVNGKLLNYFFTLLHQLMNVMAYTLAGLDGSWVIFGHYMVGWVYPDHWWTFSNGQLYKNDSTLAIWYESTFWWLSSLVIDMLWYVLGIDLNRSWGLFNLSNEIIGCWRKSAEKWIWIYV